jgi:hypothetical protein
MKQALWVCAAAVVAVISTATTFAQQATPQPAEEPAATPTAIATPVVTQVVTTVTPAPVTTEAVTVTGPITTEAVTTTVTVTTTTAVTQLQIVTTTAPAVELVITESVEAAFISLDLEAGFPLDPFLVSVNGGGPFSAAGLGSGCTGFVSRAPVVSVDWSGTEDFVEAFFYSDHDPVLVIQTPGGEILCNDDANDVLLDPVIQIDNPAQGTYHIWVGSYDQGQLIPGLLVLTTDPALNIGTFRLNELIQREPIPEDVVEPAEIRTTLLPTITARLAGAEPSTLQPGGTPITVPVVVTGTVAAFDLPIRGAVCTGFINPHIDYSFAWSGVTDNLRIFFEGDDDASLMVVGPGGAVYCNDDALGNQNLNPLVNIPNPPAGNYLVFVGRLDPDAPLSGNLTVVESSDLLPGVLAPVE